MVSGSTTGIGAIRRDHTSLPAALADGDVMHEVVERRLGGRQRLDVESLEQRTWTKVGFLQPLGYAIVGRIGVLGRQRNRRVEDARQHPVEPHARRRAAEQVIVRREQAPDLARIPLGVAAVDARDAEVLELDALAVEHAKYVVVGRQQQARGIGEVAVVRKPFRVGVTMRADDRQVFDELVEVPCNRSRGRIGREKPIGIEFVHIGSMRARFDGRPNVGRGGRH